MDKTGAATLKVNTQMTSGEAFFVLQGSPYKSNKNGETLIKAEGGVDALLQFELKFDSLRTYLEGFTTAINQHASLINQMQTEIEARLIETNLYPIIQKFGTSSIIKDRAISSILGPLLEAPRPENTGRKHDDSVNSFCNRLEVFTHGFSYFNQMNVKFNDRFDKIDKEVVKKVNTEEFKGKVKRTKAKLRTKMDENYKNLDDKIKALEAKLDTKVGALDRKIDEVEKHTTWRIKDCEDLLRSRINDTYVDDALRLLEERLKKEIEQMNLGNTENIQKSIKELAQKIQQCEDHVEDKVSGLKKNVKDIETTVTKRLETTKFEEFKKEILARIETESEKIRAVSRKCEPAIDTLNGDMVKVNEEINQLKKQIKNMSTDIENLQLELEHKNSIPIQIPVPNTTVEYAGPSKEDLENLFSKYRQDINKLKDTVKVLEDEVQSKVDSSVFNNQLAKKMDKSDIDAILVGLKNDMDKIKKFMRDSEALQSKVDKIEEIIDKKLAKFKKEFDLAAMLKQIKSKAEEENVSKGFENTDKKINTLSENLFALKKELEQALMALEKLSVSVHSYSGDAFLSTKKMNPINCLSCGSKTKQHNPVHTMMGTDGKLYRSEANQLVQIQEHSMHELYGTMQSPDLRAALNKSLAPSDGREKVVSVNYTYVQGGTGSASRIRPQTAVGRTGKLFMQPVSPGNRSENPSHRPSSAKK